MNLREHRTFITGGTRGIGLELARVLHARGAAVAVCGRSTERVAAVRAELPGVHAFHWDLSDLESLPQLVDALRAAFGVPTMLVNNAGIQFNHGWMETGPRERIALLRQEIAVNLTSPLVLTALLLDDLLQGAAAAIVNVSSLLALAPKRSAPVYCATKAAIRSFSCALRYQLAGRPSVRVVEVVPPLVDTGMTAGRGRGKISAAMAAAEIARGLERDEETIYIGRARTVRLLQRVAPGLVARLLRDG